MAVTPTYASAIKIQNAVKENGWRLVPCADGRGPCGAKRGAATVMYQENRVGGLSAVWFAYPMPEGWRCDYLGPRHPDKLDLVLAFLRNPACRGGIVGNPSGAYARRQHGRGEPDPALF